MSDIAQRLACYGKPSVPMLKHTRLTRETSTRGANACVGTRRDSLHSLCKLIRRARRRIPRRLPRTKSRSAKRQLTKTTLGNASETTTIARRRSALAIAPPLSETKNSPRVRSRRTLSLMVQIFLLALQTGPRAPVCRLTAPPAPAPAAALCKRSRRLAPP